MNNGICYSKLLTTWFPYHCLLLLLKIKKIYTLKLVNQILNSNWYRKSNFVFGLWGGHNTIYQIHCVGTTK